MLHCLARLLIPFYIQLAVVRFVSGSTNQVKTNKERKK